ncbi:cation:proton antiporter [Candidatus Dojkabacteria bacterium]|nr:cation:proton antiporter [Candidatus Dojkabacteria bacterium]
MGDLLDFAYISILLTLASCFGIIANKLKQPPLLGYILAGVLISALNIIPNQDLDKIELFSKIGVVFLLFILGMELEIKELKKLGKVVFITGIGQIIFTTIIGYFLSIIQGFSSISSIFIAISLTFSSTIVIVKILSSKKELSSLHGKIAIGFLLVQDFAAILILIGLSATSAGIASGGGILMSIVGVVIKIFVLILVLYLVSKYVIPWIIEQTGHDREVLFVSMTSWALFFATLVSIPIFGFSIEIGALCAGIALANQKENLQIESWTRPLRDFFLTVFFVMLGLHIHIENISAVLFPSIIFSLFVLIGNPIIVMLLMGFLGYNKRIGFYISLTVAQISEFSLLVAAMGVSLKFLDTNALTIITIVGGVTMTLSTYMIYYKETLYKLLKKPLSIFEFRGVSQKTTYSKQIKDHIIIFGFHRLGRDIEDLITVNKSRFLIVDHDPLLIRNLSSSGYKVVYGDMFDTDLYDKIRAENSAMIISTVPDFQANLTLLKYLKQIKYTGDIIATAQNDANAIEYYNNGCSYVLYPHLVAGQRLSKVVSLQLNTLDGIQNDTGDYLDRLARRQLPLLNRRIESIKQIN